MLDPRNEVVDPDADCLEMHPKFDAAAKDAEPLPRFAAARAALGVMDGIRRHRQQSVHDLTQR